MSQTQQNELPSLHCRIETLLMGSTKVDGIEIGCSQPSFDECLQAFDFILTRIKMLKVQEDASK